MILKDSMPNTPWKILKVTLDELQESAFNLNSEKIQYLLKQILPTYAPRTFESSIVNENQKVSSSRIQAEA